MVTDARVSSSIILTLWTGQVLYAENALLWDLAPSLMDPYALTPFRPAVKLTVCLPHHVGHTVGVCKKHNPSYGGTHLQYEKPGGRS
jgi:hypothetical protein